MVKGHSDLGLALGRNGEWAEALRSHAEAVRLQEQGEKFLKKVGGRPPVPEPGSIPPGLSCRCRLAFALFVLGNRPGAAAVYHDALVQDPRWPEKFTTKTWELITTADVNARDPQLAYELVSQAIEAVGDPPASMLDALAAAQAALGRYREAVRTAERALEKASAEGETTLAASVRQRLHYYQRGKPLPAPARQPEKSTQGS
jgi:tetratricopeptide (TPR) repeat protein